MSRPIEEEKINMIQKESFSDEHKQLIMQAYHLASRHWSIGNMKFLIRQRYQWAGIFKKLKSLDLNVLLLALKREMLKLTQGIELYKRNSQMNCGKLIWSAGCQENPPKDNKFILGATDHYTK